jgi:purine-binding chemotaxis protein CheW
MVDTAQSIGDEQLVVFNLAHESYGVEISAVREIIRLQPITKVPRTAEFVEGVINLRGKVIPVIDLRRRFGLPSAERSRASRIVVVEVGEHLLGFVVDRMSEVLHVSASQIEPPSPMVASVNSGYLRGIAKTGDRLIVLLALEKVLNTAEQQVVKQIAVPAA